MKESCDSESAVPTSTSTYSIIRVYCDRYTGGVCPSNHVSNEVRSLKVECPREELNDCCRFFGLCCTNNGTDAIVIVAESVVSTVIFVAA